MQFHEDYFIKAVYWDTRFIISDYPNPFLTNVKIQNLQEIHKLTLPTDQDERPSGYFSFTV